MAFSLHSPTSLLSRLNSGKPNNLADPDLPPISLSFRLTGRSSRPARSRIVSAKAAAPAEVKMEEEIHREGRRGEAGCNGRVPVYVMMPLDTVGICGGLARARALGASMMALRSAGVEGVMVDVWWGVVERDGPGRYDWEGYLELVRMAERCGMKLQMVMSFHQCGGNVGDSCKYVFD